MNELKGALLRGIEALGAVQVGGTEDRYAVKSRDLRAYVVVNADALRRFAVTLDANQALETLFEHCTYMPVWWSPLYRYAIRNRAGDIAARYPTRTNAYAGMAMSGDRVVTANPVTGEEEPA